MAPNVREAEAVYEEENSLPKLKAPQAEPWDYEIIYPMVILAIFSHILYIYAVYLILTSAAWLTVAYTFTLITLGVIGVTAGAHRLFTHRSYKVNTPLKLIITAMFTLSGQYSIRNWVLEHRLHHKYSDTDADPVNASRGLFFSQFGWGMVDKHPEFKRRIKYVDMSDIDNDPVYSFQTRHAAVLITLFCHLLPTLVPWVLWGETLNNAFHLGLFRFGSTLHFIGLINSVAHRFGQRPYDKNIAPTNHEVVTFFTVGEGYHNYHHTFPWDYKADEFGNQSYNLTTKFIDFFARIGWAYDLKTVDDEMISRRASRTGDGSRGVTRTEGRS